MRIMTRSPEAFGATLSMTASSTPFSRICLSKLAASSGLDSRRSDPYPISQLVWPSIAETLGERAFQADSLMCPSWKTPRIDTFEPTAG